MFDRRLVQNFDWLIVLVLLLIGTISILNLYSATFPLRGAGGSQIFVKQIYWYLLGFGVFVLMTTFSYCTLERFAYPVYLLALGLLLLVLVRREGHLRVPEVDHFVWVQLSALRDSEDRGGPLPGKVFQ